MNETMTAGQATAAAAQTFVMSALGLILAATALWGGVKARGKRPRRAARRAAESRAEALLADVLGPESYADVLARGYFDIPSRAFGPDRIYRVAYPPDGVVVLEHGVTVEHLCLLPEQWVPDADVFLTHVALLEGDEGDYLHRAAYAAGAGHSVDRKELNAIMARLFYLNRRGHTEVAWDSERALAGDPEAVAAVAEAERLLAEALATGYAAFALREGAVTRRLHDLAGLRLGEDVMLVPPVAGG